FDAAAVAVLEDMAAEMGYGLQRLRDRQRLVESLREQKLLSRAIEQADESVLVLDPTFNILYANPSTLRTSGYTHEEVIGQQPSMFGAGLASQEFLEGIWTTLSRGTAWRGTFLNRRKTGELYEEDTTISPIHDDDGHLIAFVEVKSDLSTEQQLQKNLTQTLSDQSSFVSIMRSLRAANTVHATAYVFTEAALQLPDVDLAAVMLIVDNDHFLPLSVSGSDVFGLDGDLVLPLADPQVIIALEKGPVATNMDPDSWLRNPEVRDHLAAEGFLRLVLAPIRWEGSLIGVLAIGTKDPVAAAELSTRLTYFEEIASYAGTLIGAQAQTYERRSEVRANIQSVIDLEQFHPVFQPIVDLKSGSTVGFEALTRFDDGARPDERVIEAHSVGLGPTLELALAAVALRDVPRLPDDAYVSINFSPSTLLEGRVAELVATSTRPVVIEITEHAPIDNYAAVRRAMVDLVGCRLAVDDAGAGYTSLTHILELHPDIVKLDISMVRDVDTSAAKEAMVAGMCHFASQSGTVLIAEGVETAGEAATLSRLGVALAEYSLLGQGYFFGRPEPLD
ncbi:MAG: EAL domain-containing protein, partial [Acidimicrobiales bacterium]